jgi:hypothetical protein
MSATGQVAAVRGRRLAVGSLCVDLAPDSSRQALVNLDEEWRRKGATLSDKSARKEYGLTQDEILAAIDAGQLQYRVSSIHGNLWLRLLRREVEELLDGTLNDRQHRQRRAKAELVRIDKELKQLRGPLAALEARRAGLLADLGE